MNNISAVIIYYKDKILILKRTSEYDIGHQGLWNFPGGNIEDRESPVDAAIRETKEETGLTIEEEDLLPIKPFVVGDKSVHYYMASDYKGKLKINWESDEFKWINPNEIDDYDFLEIPEEIKNFLMEL
jgi:8-oxo-dGTP diphosphatase